MINDNDVNKKYEEIIKLLEKNRKKNTNIKKVAIYFDDGSRFFTPPELQGKRTDGIIGGSGDGDGKPFFPKLRYKYGEILDISNGFVYFLEVNGNFSMIPSVRVYRIDGGVRNADEFL